MLTIGFLIALSLPSKIDCAGGLKAENGVSPPNPP
jgi:hypothetical protein